MAKREDAETQRLSRQLYREIVRRGDPEQDWWVNTEIVERDLGIKPDDMFYAAELLYEDGRVARHASDLTLLRPIHRGPSTV